MRVLENGMDEQAMIAAAQNNPSRFAELYERNFGRVYSYIVRRVEDRHDAEDLTAEVFHEALRNLPRFEWRGLPFAAWLFGIAAHLLSERWRNKARRQALFVEGDDLGSDGKVSSGCASDPKVEERAMLYELVDGLPPDQRLVILRRFVEQKSVREIAVELGRSEGAIKQLQFRALQNLRMQIGSRHGESIRS